VYVSDEVETFRSILSLEDDFNVALDAILEFLGKRGKLDPEDPGCLCIRDILDLKRAFDVLHSVQLGTDVANVAHRDVVRGSLLSFLELDV
jgi:hypothetical protein